MIGLSFPKVWYRLVPSSKSIREFGAPKSAKTENGKPITLKWLKIEPK